MENVGNAKVTVCMITKNRDTLMLYAIESILSQTYNNYELVILDGGSDDSSVNTISELSKKDPRVKWLNFPNNNYVIAYSKIISWAKGEYIAFMEADDLCTPNKIQAQADYLDTHKNIDVVSCTTLFNSKTGIATTINELSNAKITELLKTNDINTVCPFQSTMIRKSAIEKVFGKTKYYMYPEFFEGHAGDAFLYTLFYNGCKFANITCCAYIYRLGQAKDSMTTNTTPNYFIENLLGKDQRARKKCINSLYKKYIVSNE